MRKRFFAGVVVSLVAALGLWLSLGTGAAQQPRKASGVSAGSVQVSLTASRATQPTAPAAADSDTVRSGDQTTPDTSASESEASSESEAGSIAETDSVDCQQQGQFEGVNTAGSGPGCDGSGT